MRFQVYSRKTFFGRRWFWRLRARNHEIIAHGEAYNTKAACLHAIELIRNEALMAPVEETA